MSSIANSAMPFNNSASDGLTITGVIWNQAMQTIVTSVNDNATQINNIRNAQITILVGTGSVYPTSPIPSNGQLFYRTDLQALKMFNGTSWIDPVQEPTSYVDLTTGQTIGGSKTFTNPLTIKTDTSGALTIERASNTNQQILIDYDSANNRGRIQTVEQGVSYRDLILNASGGQVLTQHNIVDNGSGGATINGQLFVNELKATNAGGAGLDILVDASQDVQFYRSTGYGTILNHTTGDLTVGGNRINLTAGSAGEKRFHIYNGGGIAEWIWGQKSNTSHDWTLTKLVGATETDFFTVGTDGTAYFWQGSVRIGSSVGSLYIGDDAVIEDFNSANALRLKGVENPALGDLYFGTNNYKAYHQGNHHHQFRHDMFRGANTFTTTSNTAFSAGGNGFLPFLFTASEFSGTTSFIMEFNGFAGSSETLYAGIWDYTAGAAVAGSEASITSVTGARARSGSCTLIDGHLYGYYYRASAALSSCVIGAVDIICWPGG